MKTHLAGSYLRGSLACANITYPSPLEGNNGDLILRLGEKVGSKAKETAVMVAEGRKQSYVIKSLAKVTSAKHAYRRPSGRDSKVIPQHGGGASPKMHSPPVRG